MKLARRATDDPERLNELKASLDDKVSELVAEANDAGYSTGETMAALLTVVQNQAVISAEDPDPADDPGQESDPPFPAALDAMTIRIPSIRARAQPNHDNIVPILFS